MGDGTTKEEMGEGITKEMLDDYDKKYVDLMAKYLELRSIINMINKLSDLKEI